LAAIPGVVDRQFVCDSTAMADRMIDILGWRTTGLRNRFSDRRWERRLGINTEGSQEVNRPDANRYATFAHRSIEMILNRLALNADDVFVDIGCGKGRVVCRAALRPIRQVIGVDIDADLCNAAEQNVKSLVGAKAPVRIINLPAQEFDYLDCTAFFLFNSFGASTLEQVLATIHRSLAANPRSIRFAYVNPFHEHLLKQVGWLEEYDRFARRPWSGLKFDVSFWRTPGGGVS